MYTSSISASRFRYREEAPEFITLPVSELLDRLPREFRRDGEVNGRNIDLPCRDLLVGNTPRFSLAQLHNLLPDLVHFPEGADRGLRLTLPAGWVALHFRLITKREEIPVEDVLEAPQSSIADSNAISADIGTSVWVEGDMATGVVEASLERTIPLEEKQEETAMPSSENIKPQASPPQEIAPLPLPRRSFFSSLLNFRRHHKTDPSSPTLDEKPEVLQAGKDVSQRPLSKAQGGEGMSAQKTDASPSLSLDHLWKLDPQDQIADSSALQALFMTEEKLTLDRVISMAGQLPGLRACVLAHGDQVVCAPNTQPGVDLQTLSGQAMIMLTQIRESSAKMGIGSVPAVTLHADQGVLSFLHNGELCLLVLHADRGFVPGVRERLQEMLFHLSSAKALPGVSSSQASLPI